MTSPARVVVIAIGILSVVLRSECATAQDAAFHASPWKDCRNSSCDAGEAMTYLLWSRQSDNNQCKLVLDLAGHRDQRSACDSLVPASGLQAIDEIGVVAGIRRFIANQINSFPLPWGSAAAGFAYSVDPQTGLPRFQTYSFGPFFAERPLTSGRGAWNVQVTAQRTDWRSIDDVPLRRIAFESYRAPTDRCTADACLSQRFVSELNLT